MGPAANEFYYTEKLVLLEMPMRQLKMLMGYAFLQSGMSSRTLIFKECMTACRNQHLCLMEETY